MTQTKLKNIIVQSNTCKYTVYKPKNIKNNNSYKIIFTSKIIEDTHIQFTLYANFIYWIEFNSFSIQENKQKMYLKYDIIPHQGILLSFDINVNKYFIINIKPIDFCTNIIIKNILSNQIDNKQLIQLSWDNIFIINLSRRSDRKISMIGKLAIENIGTYEFIEAFDGLDANINLQYLDYKTNKNIPIITSGHFACLLSHIKAIKLAKSRGYKNIMVLEDDVYFCSNFLNKLQKLFIPNFDMLYLGGIISKSKHFMNDWIYAKNIKIMGAYGYILNHGLYDIILDKLEELNEYIDIFFIKKIQPYYNVILLNDYIKTDLLSSDTSHKSKKIIERLGFITNQ